MSENPKIALSCMICSNDIDSTTDSEVNLFEDKATVSSDKPLFQVICSTLGIKIDKKKIGNPKICKDCYNHFLELEELQAKLAKARKHIVTAYKATVSKVSKDESKDLFDEDSTEVFSPISNPLENIELNPGSISSGSEIQQLEDQEKHSTASIDILKTEDFGSISVIKKENLTKGNSAKEALPKVENKATKKKKVPSAPLPPVITKEGDSYNCILCLESESESKKTECDAKTIVTHLKKEHDIRIYICDLCGDHFRKRNELSAHLDEHVAKEPGDFECDVCKRVFNNLRLFRIHKRIHYPQTKAWVCDTCGKRYSSKNLLDEHTNTHTGKRPYVCDVCGKDFFSKYTYRSHCKTHDPRARPYECKECGKNFLSQQNLNQHIKTHNGIKDFICETCGKGFGSQHNLDVHNIIHTGYKPYICKTCGKAFARKAEIRDHERIHTGEKPYQCELCGSTFSQRSNLQSHKRATHFNDKRYKCDECGKGFKRRRLLDYHIRAAHTGERPYKCDTCSSTFVYPEHYKKHLRIHTGEKPYLCEVCGKAFNSRDNRNAHRFIHSDKKPYECLVCGMGFMRKPLLYAHMQTQGHINDTIVVNQPRLTTEDEIVLEEDTVDEDDTRIRIIMQSDTEAFDENDVVVTELKDVIIQEDEELENGSGEDGTEIIYNDEDSTMVVEQYESEDNQEESDFVECKDEVIDDVYDLDNESTLVLPPGTDYKELIGNVRNGSVRLVQIHIPQSSSSGDSKSWFSVVQNSD